MDSRRTRRAREIPNEGELTIVTAVDELGGVNSQLIDTESGTVVYEVDIAAEALAQAGLDLLVLDPVTLEVALESMSISLYDNWGWRRNAVRDCCDNYINYCGGGQSGIACWVMCKTASPCSLLSGPSESVERPRPHPGTQPRSGEPPLRGRHRARRR